MTIIIKTKSEQNIKNIIEGQTRKPICFLFQYLRARVQDVL